MHAYDRIALVIRYLEEHHAEQPDLAALARYAGLSQFHLHRLFHKWAGITPKDFLQCLTVARAKELLQGGATVLDASLHAGLSGPGRLHDLCVTLEAASPGEIRSGGEGWTISVGVGDSPFGRCLVGNSPRGICHLSFIEPEGVEGELEALQRCWPQARLRRSDRMAARLLSQVFERSAQPSHGLGLRAFVRGTAFQVRVWQALLRIPPGTLVSYGRLAAVLENANAARAVGTAVGQNPLAYLIPCHRVIRETGMIGEYRWGSHRKRAIVAWEGALRGVVASDGADANASDPGDIHRDGGFEIRRVVSRTRHRRGRM